MLPENTFRHIGHMIGLIERVSRSYADEYLKELGLSRGQIPYLMVLYHNEGISQDFLAKGLVMDKSSTARALLKLETAGFIRREQNPQDKRENLVYLTEAGREIHPIVKQLNGQWIEHLSGDLNEVEIVALEAILSKMSTKARDFRNKTGEL